MIENLLCSVWEAILAIVSGYELGMAIEYIVNRKYCRGGISLILSICFMLHIVRIMFCW